MRTISVVFLIAFCVGQTTPSAEPREFNTSMMQSTLRISGNNTMGTAFIVGRAYPNSREYAYVLVTAAHVLKDINSDTATLSIRTPDAQKHWQVTQGTLQIRSNGRPLWAQHATADVAAIYVPLPEGAIPLLVTESVLATDNEFAKYEIHPGDDLNVLGYPLGASGPSDFPILRSGKIASYPLIPTKDNPYFLLDFRVFRGNSGGPVYLVDYNRTYGGAINAGTLVLLLGLVSEEILFTQQIQEVYESRVQTTPLNVAKIVPSTLIRETIDMLPPPQRE